MTLLPDVLKSLPQEGLTLILVVFLAIGGAGMYLLWSALRQISNQNAELNKERSEDQRRQRMELLKAYIQGQKDEREREDRTPGGGIRRRKDE